MTKNPKSGGISPKNSPSGPKPVEVKAFALRDERGSPEHLTMEKAMERVWRNCMYPERVTFDMYYKMYSRNNVAARVIETFPDYSWAAIPFVSDNGGSESRFSKAAMAMLSRQYPLQDGVRQSLLASMKQLDVLGGIGGEALLVFGFADGRKLEQPVKKTPDCEIAYVKILHNGQFKVHKRVTEETSPNFGDVELYESVAFSPDSELNAENACHIAPNVKIHATRCVHFKESAGLTYGTSRIQKCYNQLLDITKLSGASAEVYWLGAFSGLSIETNPLAQLSDESYKKMRENTQRYFDGLARALIFEGATSKLLYPAIVSPKDHFDLQITQVSIATGIPRRFLTGAEAAKLASQQDTLNWMERITNRRELFVGPKVVSPVIQRCIDAGVLPKPRGDNFTTIWPRIQSIALNERADASRNMTAAWESYFTTGMAGIMPFRVYLLYACGFSEVEADDIANRCNEKKWKEMVKIAQKAAATKTAEPAKKTDKTDESDEPETDE